MVLYVLLNFVVFRGACGLVKLAFVKETCRKVAVKIIETKQFSIGGTTLKVCFKNKCMNSIDYNKCKCNCRSVELGIFDLDSFDGAKYHMV